MRCRKCGEHNSSDSKFCSNCGSLLKGEDSSRAQQKKCSRKGIVFSVIAGVIVLGIGFSLVVTKVLTKDDVDVNSTLAENKVENQTTEKNDTKNVAKEEEKKEEKEEENIDDKIDEKVNEKLEEKVNEKVDEKVEQKLRESFEKGKKNDSGYIMPSSDQRYLSEQDLIGYNKTELALIRNEVYARYGYVFESPKYRDYFGRKTWYTPNYNITNLENYFNDYEMQNVKLLKRLEGK